MFLLTVSCDQRYLSLLCITMLAVPKSELFLPLLFFLFLFFFFIFLLHSSVSSYLGLFLLVGFVCSLLLNEHEQSPRLVTCPQGDYTDQTGLFLKKSEQVAARVEDTNFPGILKKEHVEVLGESSIKIDVEFLEVLMKNSWNFHGSLVLKLEFPPPRGVTQFCRIRSGESLFSK